MPTLNEDKVWNVPADPAAARDAAALGAAWIAYRRGACMLPTAAATPARPATANTNVAFWEGAQVHQAFLASQAVKVLLPTGTLIYKYNEYSGFPTTTSLLSPWWSPYDRYEIARVAGTPPELSGAEDLGWMAKVKFATANGMTVMEWGRYCAAVREDWNSLKYLLVLRLPQPVWAFCGRFTPQDRLSSAPGAASRVVTGASPASMSSRPTGTLGEGKALLVKRLNGMGLQFYIPDLAPANVTIMFARDLTQLGGLPATMVVPTPAVVAPVGGAVTVAPPAGTAPATGAAAPQWGIALAQGSEERWWRDSEVVLQRAGRP